MEEQESTNYQPIQNPPPVVNDFNDYSKVKVMSVKEWLLIFVIMILPIVNIVMLFIWAFGSETNKIKSNWAKATLIWMVIVIVLYILFFAAFGASMMSMMEGMGGGPSVY